MKKLTLLLAAIVVNILVFAQQVESQNVNQSPLQKGLGVEMLYQDAFGFSTGGLITKNIGNKMKANYGLGIMMDVYFVDQAIFSPRLKIFYNYLTIFGFGLSLNDYFLPGTKDTRICPEVNFSLFGRATVSVGYGAILRKTRIEELSNLKIGLSINLVN